jgi:drug/metabolite transporter (DMT)-like permease
MIGSVIGFGGVGLIFSEDLSVLGGPRVAVAAAVMLVAPAVSAVASVAIKRWGGAIHPFSLSAVPMALAAGVMGGLALAFERGRPMSWDPLSIGALLYLAIAGSAVTFSLYYWLLARLPAKRLALIAYVVPVVAVAVGALRGEPLTRRTLAGSALVVVGVALAVQLPGWRAPSR